MKKIVFVCSHVYSGSSQLCDAMDANPRMQVYGRQHEQLKVGQDGKPFLEYSLPSRSVYSTPSDLLNLTDNRHKMSSSAAIYVDELLQNYQFSIKEAYSICKFVYVVREPSPVLNYMQAKFRTRPEYASRYYLYRMRRICEMAKRTPGAVLLTFDDLRSGRGIDLLREYLCLKQDIEWDPSMLTPVRMRLNQASIEPEALAQVEEGWERYLYFLRSLALRRPR